MRGIPIDKQILTQKYRVLDNNATIADYVHPNDSTLHLKLYFISGMHIFIIL